MSETDEQPELEEDEPLAREGEHIAPAFEKSAYHCPYCGVLAPQQRDQLRYLARGLLRPKRIREPDIMDEAAPAWIVRCSNCRRDQYWIEFEEGVRMVKPLIAGGPAPASGHAR